MRRRILLILAVVGLLLPLALSLYITYLFLYGDTGVFRLGGGLTPDAWESARDSRPDSAGCARVDGAFLAPVPAAARADAIARLEGAAAVALGRADANTLLAPPKPARKGVSETGAAPEVSAARRLATAIARLAERRGRALAAGGAGWSDADQDRLEALRALAARTGVADLRPFLIRAVAKNQRAGAFSARLCAGDVLWVHHQSLRRSTAPSARWPVIVFLARAPETVFVDWGMAE